MPMRVSFDLDEALFVNPETHKAEPPLPFPYNKLYRERLRLGTPELIKQIQSEGIEVWVYTSSYRTQSYIKGLFKKYGVRFDGIINAQRHAEEVQEGRKMIMPQKMPGLYHISLHIDDEESVVISGRAHGFNVYRLNEQDDEWTRKIMDRIHVIKNNMKR